MKENQERPAGIQEHPFFELDNLSGDERRHLFGQWYVAARKHKQLFPWLVAITKSDPVRFELIQILHDEYGKGNPLFVHGNLLEQTVRFLGIDPQSIVPGKGNQEFSATTERVWKDEREPVTAYGYHHYLEDSASLLHKKLYALLHDVPDVYKLYSAYHEFAEAEHAQISAKGLKEYTDEPNKLQQGAAMGATALRQLLDALMPPSRTEKA